jgi:hypothetical protein
MSGTAEAEKAMLGLTLIVCVVSVALVTLFSGIAMMWTLITMLMGICIESTPRSSVVVNGVFVFGTEWLCVSAVTGFIARKWFPHVRGGLFLAMVIPALVTVASAAAFWNPFAPVAGLTSGMPEGRGHRAAAPLAAVAPALINSASRGPESLAQRRLELAVLLVISAALLALGWAALAAVIIALLWALPSRKWRHRDAAIRLAAVQGHRNQAILRWVATHDKDPAVRQAAQERQAAL